MNLQQLIEWQWSDYTDKHRNRGNLLIHIVTVPLFWFASFWILGALLLMLMGVPHSFRMLFWALVMIGISAGAQAIGHSMENTRPEPAKDTLEMVRRIAVEQFITFPRFVLSGNWLNNLKVAF